MRIYVAAKFQAVDRVRALYKRLEALGHVITHDWTHEDAGTRTGAELRAYLTSCALADIRGVETADAVIVLHHPQGRGLFVELGVALTHDKLVIAVGDFGDDTHFEKQCIFYWCPSVARVPDEDAAMTALGEAH